MVEHQYLYSMVVTKRRFSLKQHHHFINHVIFIYLELACLEEQNGCQSFNLQARIAELWRFKSRKVEKLTKKIV